MLLAHVDGTDRYGGDAELCDRIAEAFHPVQVSLADKLDLSGIPDGRIDAERVRRVAAPFFDTIDGLAELIDEVPAAVVYAGVLDAIEPSEWPYHADDVPACLTAAVGASIVRG